jgi:two-component system, CitB family, sensor kinase
LNEQFAYSAFRAFCSCCGEAAHQPYRDRVTRRLSFASQALLLQLGVLLAVLLAGLALVALLLQRELEDQYEQRALGIARGVAADPAYAVDIQSQQPSPIGDAELRAEAVRRRTGALFVVVTDDAGRRYSHPNTALIGQRVSTDPTAALAGHDVVALERGTLGLSARGKVPLRNAAGGVVGEVSVGIDARAVHRRLVQLIRATLGFGGVALLIGAAGSILLSRRLKRQTLGLEPSELADLVREHEAVLHGIENGVVAVEAGRVSMTNDEACRLLGAQVRPGADVLDVLPPRLGRLVSAGEEVTDVLVVHGDRTLVVSTRPVQRHGRDLGTVVTIQDRTQLEHLSRELETVQTLFDALRAQAHEHTNRLHALQGMLHLGHVEQAEDYLRELADAAVPGEDGEPQVADPYLRGLLVAKAAVAAERGVQLRLSDDSYLAGQLTAPLDVVTVLGNLLDNAIRAAAAGSRRPAWVEVALAADDLAMHCAVTDSGAGLPDGALDRVFDDGWTTQPDDGRAHGLGLALARQAARRHDGDVQVLAASGADHGAVFAAQLRHVVTAAVAAP